MTIRSQQVFFTVLLLFLPRTWTFVWVPHQLRHDVQPSLLVCMTQTKTQIQTQAFSESTQQPTRTIKRQRQRQPRQQSSSSSSTSSSSTSTSTRPRRTFAYQLAQLQHYHTTYGTCLVDPTTHVDLALWTDTIRYKYRHQALSIQPSSPDPSTRPILPQSKLDQLNAISFVWTNRQGITWNQTFDKLNAFKMEHGHCNVPLQDHPTLAVWVRNQRRDYRYFLAKKTTGLTIERIQRLKSIGFWDSYIPKKERWDRRYQQLQAFHRKYGHSNVPEDYSDNYQLGQWVMNQRLWYKQYRAGLWTALTPDRIELLERIDFAWSIHTMSWNAMLHRLKNYQQQHSTLKIKKHDTDNQDLRRWLIQQRFAHNHYWQHNTTMWLTDQRVQALEQICNFQWQGRKRKEGPSTSDWRLLFEGMKEKGITIDSKPKEHWFDGKNRFEEDINEFSTEDDLIDLWNQEGDDD